MRYGLFWPCGHEGQTFFDLLAKIQARRIKRSNDWGKTLFFKKNLVLFIVELSVIFFSTLIFSTLNTTLNSTLDTLQGSKWASLADHFQNSKYDVFHRDYGIVI